MRSRLPWFLIAAAIAIAAAVRFFRDRQGILRAAPSAPPLPAAEPQEDPRADELRRRIEESRAVVDERDRFEEAETPLDEADPDARRREVHARAREAVERMRTEDESEN